MGVIGSNFITTIVMTKKIYVLMAALAVLTSSCTSRLTDFTVISTKSVSLESTKLAKASKRVKGVDKAHMILFIPLGAPNLKEAIDKAIEQYPGAVALADGVVKSKWMSFLLYGQTSYIVEGTPLYPADLQASNSGTSMMKITHQVNREKDVKELAKMYQVSEDEIMKWNELGNSTLTSGQEIIIYLPNKIMG